MLHLTMRLAIDTSGIDQAIVVLDGRRVLVAELASWLPSSARVITEPAGMLVPWSPAQAHLEIAQADRRPLSAALADSAIWTFESQKPLRYDEVQALYVQPAAAEERARKAP